MGWRTCLVAVHCHWRLSCQLLTQYAANKRFLTARLRSTLPYPDPLADRAVADRDYHWLPGRADDRHRHQHARGPGDVQPCRWPPALRLPHRPRLLDLARGRGEILLLSGALLRTALPSDVCLRL